MCNYIHREGEKVPKTGYAYKVFKANPSNKSKTRFYFSPIFRGGSLWTYKNMKRDGTFVWDNTYGNGDGFCFLTKLKDARRVAIANWGVICRVAYNQGLEKHVENGITILIAKEFRILHTVA